MRSLLILTVLCALALGCQAKPSTTRAASAPKVIEQLTDQTLVWSCPKCGMDYDGPGKCPMCDVDLVKTQVAYICPADQKPVEHSGKCPRCEANAKVVRTALAEGAAESPSGTTPKTSGGTRGGGS